MRPINTSTISLTSSLWSSERQGTPLDEESLLICYGDLSLDVIKDYDLVILEAGHYTSSEICGVKQHNDRVLAYLSLTEINHYDPFFSRYEESIVGSHPHWDSAYIDIRANSVRELLLARVELLRKMGFDGLLLDTLDNVGPWGSLSGMEEELKDLLRNLRIYWPQAFLLQNGGTFLGETCSDAILVESVVTDYNFYTKSYRLRTRDEYKGRLMQLGNIDKKIYLLEYADTAEAEMEITSRLKCSGYTFFIGNIALNTLPVFRKNEVQ